MIVNCIVVRVQHLDVFFLALTNVLLFELGGHEVLVQSLTLHPNSHTTTHKMSRPPNH